MPDQEHAAQHAARPGAASLDGWLAQQLNRHAQTVTGTLLIDVGAYQGAFARTLLASTPFSSAILFEPNPANAAGLAQAVADDPRLRLEPLALGAATADATFYCTDDPATGSLLPYAPASLAPGTPVDRYPVRQTTLDHYLAEQNDATPVGLIKIDTQGYDLQVLEGAVQTVRRHHPWLVVELIFGPLYERQTEPAALFTWLYERGYSLAALFNLHYAADAWVAFADAVFVPPTVARQYEAPYYDAMPTVASLQHQVQHLHAVCAERLALIHHLHEEAAQRLAVIEQLEQALREKNAN